MEDEDPQAIYKALARFSGLPRADLTPGYRQDLIVDQLGRVKRRTAVRDPVTEAARHFTAEDALRWAAIPLTEEDGRLTVAIADPLDEAALAAIEAAVAPLRVNWVVAGR